MQCYLRYRKAIIIAVISVLALLLFSSCTAKKAVDEEVFPTATPDSGSTADTPIANDRFGDDFVIDIEKPDTGEIRTILTTRRTIRISPETIPGRPEPTLIPI